MVNGKISISATLNGITGAQCLRVCICFIFGESFVRGRHCGMDFNDHGSNSIKLFLTILAVLCFYFVVVEEIYIKF